MPGLFEIGFWIMRFSKPLAAVGIIGVTLLSGTALTGTAFADATRPHPSATARHNEDRRTHPHKTAATTPSVEASLNPDTIGQGGAYTVSVTTTNIDDGADATVTAPTTKAPRSPWKATRRAPPCRSPGTPGRAPTPSRSALTASPRPPRSPSRVEQRPY